MVLLLWYDDVHSRKRTTGICSYLLSKFDDVHSRKHRTTGSWSYSYLLLWFGDTMHSRKHGTTGSCSAYYRGLTMCTAEKTRPQAFCPTYDCGLTTSTSEKHRPTGFLSYYCGLRRKVHPESFFRSCLLCTAYAMKLGQKCSEKAVICRGGFNDFAVIC